MKHSQDYDETVFKIKYAQGSLKRFLSVMQKTDTQTLTYYFGMTEDERDDMIAEEYEVDVGNVNNMMITTEKNNALDNTRLTFMNNFDDLPFAQQMGALAYNVKLSFNQHRKKYPSNSAPLSTAIAATALAVSSAYELTTKQCISSTLIAYAVGSLLQDPAHNLRERRDASLFQARFNHYITPLENTKGQGIYAKGQCTVSDKLRATFLDPWRGGDLSKSESLYINAKVDQEEARQPGPKISHTDIDMVTKNTAFAIRNYREEQARRAKEYREKESQNNNNSDKPKP